MSEESGKPRKRLLYGRQHGHRLRARQERLMRDLLPQLAADPVKIGRSGLSACFNPLPDRVFLEIGFGGGEHLAARSAACPQDGFIGAEPYLNGVAKLLSEIDESSVRNIRILHGDARDLIDALPDGSIDGAFLLYPDPWPKKRHHKRRFVSPENLAGLHRILRPGATFLFASDIEDYVSWTLRHVLDHGGFRWQAEGPDDWRRPPEGWPGTRYEAKALREGRRPHYLSFERT
ncbi:MAG: tRNA (guanine(46)-N(7))-methyltransferase TrmB [Pseudomonadota bacterium]